MGKSSHGSSSIRFRVVTEQHTYVNRIGDERLFGFCLFVFWCTVYRQRSVIVTWLYIEGSLLFDFGRIGGWTGTEGL